MVIYKIINKTNLKVYIGKTTRTSKERGEQHLSEAYNPKQKSYNFPIHKAIRKYGIENFIVEDIDQATFEEELNLKEKYGINYFIKLLGKELVYNLAAGGNGGATRGSGWHHTEEAKQKMSENHNCNSNKNRPTQSEEAKKKIGDANRGEKNGMYGKTHEVSQEVRQKISQAHKNKILTDEHKQKLSEAHKGKAKGKVSIHKNNVVKYILPAELEEYLKNDGKLGTGRFKK